MTSQDAKKQYPFSHLNAWRMHRQWLDRSFESGNLLKLIDSTGWIYSPGCSTPYLSIWARVAGFQPSALDRLVFQDHTLIQLETLRGCTMLVPREQAAVGLRVRSRAFTELVKQARPQMPITEDELDRLKTAVLQALEGRTATYDAILHAAPAELVREFPPELRRIGLTGSLSLAINLLKEEARLIKVQSPQRLDSTEYSFALVADALPEVDPFQLRVEPAHVALAAQYFRAEGPARVKDFAWWAGINVTDAMRAAAEVRPRLAAIQVAGHRDEFLLSASALAEFEAFKPAAAPAVNFIPYRDVFLKGQREVVNRFVRTEDADKPFSRWKGKLINDPLATIVKDGEVIGVWEWIPEGEGRLEYVLFEDHPPPVLARIDEKAHDLATFVREHLGEIRLQGIQYGRHQMTRIRDLQPYWGHGTKVDVGAV